MFFGPHFLGGEDPKILNLVFKIAPISDHVAKFRGDRPRDRGDLALKKKKKQQQSIRARPGGPNNSVRLRASEVGRMKVNATKRQWLTVWAWSTSRDETPTNSL